MVDRDDQRYGRTAMTEDKLRTALWHEAWALTGDQHDAEDLVQECLAVLMLHRDSIRNPRSRLAWCRVVMRNLFRQRLRRRWWERLFTAEELPQVASDPWPAVQAKLFVEAGLKKLPERQGQALRAFYLRGQSLAEIGADFDRPEGTIKRWLHEGRESMRMQMGIHTEGAQLARIYAPDWEKGVRENVSAAVTKAGYTPVISRLPKSGLLPSDTALFVFGEQVGCRSGLELLLTVRATPKIAEIPVLLFGSARKTAILAAWQAQADVYLTGPSHEELADLLRQLRGGTLE
jgi:RNA polymerase sigma-70 factor (ECF subfamily)